MKFSIRDLLLVTVIVAVCVAWYVDHRRRGAEIQTLKEQSNVDVRFFQAILSPNLPTSSAPAPNQPAP
jgi:hypothetical protein